MLSMSTATVLYFLSFASRLRGRRGKGIALGMLAAGAATVGGYFGGDLVFGSSKDDADAAETAASVTRLAGVQSTCHDGPCVD